MKDPDLIHWANASQSEFVRGFAFRLIAKRMYKKGMLHSAIEYATRAMKEYPENCNIFSQVCHDVIKYQFSLLVFDQHNNNEEMGFTRYEEFDEIIGEIEE